LTEAVQALTAAGLRYHAVEVSSSLEPGTVTAQDPSPGTRVVKGTDVRVNVSKGLPPVPVPNVIGQSQADASSALKDAGFTVGPTREENSDKPAGTVIDTDPKVGTSLQRGSSVSLIVSKGPQVGIVPDVTGSNLPTAVAALRAAGFKVQVNKVDTENQTEDGVVVSQTPDGNTQAPLDSIVAIDVGQYIPPPTTETTPIEPVSPPPPPPPVSPPPPPPPVSPPPVSPAPPPPAP
jgi:serine/threonine-protein kinase